MDTKTYITVAIPEGVDPNTDEILLGLRAKMDHFDVRFERSTDGGYHVVGAHVHPDHDPADSKLPGLELVSLARAFICETLHPSDAPT